MDTAKVELLRALGRVVRGLSAIFWALPLTLFFDAVTTRTDWFRFLGDAAFAPAMIGGAVLYHGLRQLRDFQKQERIWIAALNRAEFLAVVNIGLSPFLFWWRRFPQINFYIVCTGIFVFATFLFLIQINHVLRRLSAMLPDEHLREETNMFTSLNVTLFLCLFIGLALCASLARTRALPYAIARIFSGSDPQGLWFVLFMGLFPLAMTLAILWRIKEVIFLSLFAAEH